MPARTAAKNAALDYTPRYTTPVTLRACAAAVDELVVFIPGHERAARARCREVVSVLAQHAAELPRDTAPVAKAKRLLARGLTARSHTAMLGIVAGLYAEAASDSGFAVAGRRLALAILTVTSTGEAASANTRRLQRTAVRDGLRQFRYEYAGACGVLDARMHTLLDVYAAMLA